MALTLKQIDDICMVGSGSAQCRYLCEDDNIVDKYYCLKLVVDQKKEIDKEVKEFIKKHESRGIDPSSMGLPISDNCSGYRYLNAKMQGYDLDGKVP